MNINAILKDFKMSFPIFLVFQIKQGTIVRIAYVKSPGCSKMTYESNIEERTLYELNLEQDLDKKQKKALVQHVMRRLSYKFSFFLSEVAESDDRCYIKLVMNEISLRKNLMKIYLMLDQQIGVIDRSVPQTFFE